MKPREALDVFKAFAEDMRIRISADRFEWAKPEAREAITHAAEAVVTLERLVSKDEAEARYATGLDGAKYLVGRTECTCGTSTPCPVWGHS